MNIIIKPKLKEYLESKRLDSITVDIIKKRSNCCAVGTPKATEGAPSDKELGSYTLYLKDDIKFYVDRDAPILNDELIFDYNKLFMLSMIEVHGIDFERML
ncbi:MULTISPECIES: hypothetical protein [unclassified Fusibacter]|uniref:hypothetical protein n=1 Tax=unclassified Fusibacter TaxID=2624464 RepID=UPI001012FA05|nr:MULTISPECIES: hypothetical protein [unclassified Fusibacter]MCK8058286.1 hypothetical protein [Fusibacter sp. A2]NPE20869.1 hypothetical protein [Fusibacter sp. A1]RXV63073.1 hypothetical protein DWB64_03475 [Fusibacter sp. A1]